MSDFYVHPSRLRGEVDIPPSKSQTLRAILFASLAQGRSVIRRPLLSPDIQSMLRACSNLGARIEQTPNEIFIIGVNGDVSYSEDIINAGNSGIVLRFMTAIGALASHPVVITGDDSVKRRPMRPLLDGLEQLGALSLSMRGDNYAPVVVRGPLKPGSVTLDGKDSQPISALLIAANFIEGVTEVTVTDPGEKPWVEMTLSWFDRLNIPYLSEDYTHYRIQGKSPYTGFHYTVKGDWSSAAFPLAAALVTRSTLKLNGLDLEEPQGDKQLIPILEAMGAKITWDNDQLVVHATETLKGTTIDVNDLIDALPILAVIGCFAEGETRLVNGAVAATKESNRLEVIASELRKMGAAIEQIDDGLLIHHSPLVGAEVDSHKDHRIAMALTVAALGAKGATRIKDIECVRKTFPNFCPSLQKVGALMERQ